MQKAIFFDIDGTLIDWKQDMKDMTPVVKDAIRKLQAADHYVFIATGRPYAFLSEVILNFGFDGFILANGAQVILNNRMIFKEAINPSYIKELTREFDALHAQYILEDECYSYMKENFKEYYAFFDEVGISRKYLKGEYNLEDIEVLKAEVRCPNKEVTDQCEAIVKKNPEYGYYRSINEISLEIFSKKNTKATAILKTLEYLDIPVEDSFAFGDGENDIEMLATVGCGIAMDNASDEVKQHAKIITGSVQDDGVAQGIEKYILNDNNEMLEA